MTGQCSGRDSKQVFILDHIGDICRTFCQSSMEFLYLCDYIIMATDLLSESTYSFSQIQVILFVQALLERIELARTT